MSILGCFASPSYLPFRALIFPHLLVYNIMHFHMQCSPRLNAGSNSWSNPLISSVAQVDFWLSALQLMLITQTQNVRFLVRLTELPMIVSLAVTSHYSVLYQLGPPPPGTNPRSRGLRGQSRSRDLGIRGGAEVRRSADTRLRVQDKTAPSLWAFPIMLY